METFNQDVWSSVKEPLNVSGRKPSSLPEDESATFFFIRTKVATILNYLQRNLCVSVLFCIWIFNALTYKYLELRFLYSPVFQADSCIYRNHFFPVYWVVAVVSLLLEEEDSDTSVVDRLEMQECWYSDKAKNKNQKQKTKPQFVVFVDFHM